MENKHELIDMSYLYEISNGNNEFIHDLINMLFKQLPEYQTILNNLYETKDWINLGKLAHKAKSAILMVGMKDLAEDLKNLEENAKEGKDIHEYKEIIVKFVRLSNIAIKELKDINDKI